MHRDRAARCSSELLCVPAVTAVLRQHVLNTCHVTLFPRLDAGGLAGSGSGDRNDLFSRMQPFSVDCRNVHGNRVCVGVGVCEKRA